MVQREKMEAEKRLKSSQVSAWKPNSLLPLAKDPLFVETPNNIGKFRPKLND